MTFLITFLFSASGLAQSDAGESFTGKSKQCFEIFSIAHAAHFARLKNYGLQYRKPEYQTFLRLNAWMFRLDERLPKEMHPQLKLLAAEVISGYENAVPFTVRIFQEYFDSNDAQTTNQFIADYYMSLISARLIGSNLGEFERLIGSDVATGVEYLNHRRPLISHLTLRGIH